MNEFLKARLKLTFLYIILSAVMLGAFSFAAIQSERRAFKKIDAILSDRTQRPNLSKLMENRLRAFDSDFIETLMTFNVAVLFGASIASYFLSGYTLKPIQEMVQRQEEFSQDASHELRTPLTTINMEIESLKRTDNKSFLQNKETFLSIQEEVKRMSKLTDGLLFLVRKENGSQSQVVDIKISELITEVASQMKAQAQEKKIDIVAQVSEGIMIRANRDQIKQVMLILIDNGIKYSSESTKIHIKAVQTKRFIEIVVADEGVGIPDSEISHVFERFYRVSGNKGSGSGLGLAIAKKLVEQNKGKIRVESKLGKGSSFFLSFS